MVIRRGPSRFVATLLWNRDDDSFQMGQWLKGRIYERRCDLSPNGEFFLYFAMNGKWQSEVKGSWSAISRAPFLKALALFPKGDCWQGGGLWTGKYQYWLNGCSNSALYNTRLVQRDESYAPAKYFGSECTGVYYPRLLRDGWKLRGEHEESRMQSPHVFEKQLPDGWLLRKLAHAEVDTPEGKGCYWDEHELAQPSSNARMAFPHWEWAEWDRERLVWASAGKLYGARVGAGGLHEERLLHDFNGMSFEPIEAPY